MLFQPLLLVLGVILWPVNGAQNPVCEKDNVLRALQNCAGVASTFCAKLLASTTATHFTLTAPTCVSQFPSSRLPSACSCLTSFPASSASASTTFTTSKVVSSTSSSLKSTTSSSKTSSTSPSSSQSSSSTSKSATASSKTSSLVSSSTRSSTSSSTTSSSRISSSPSMTSSSVSSTKSSISSSTTSSSRISSSPSKTSSLVSSTKSSTYSATTSSSRPSSTSSKTSSLVTSVKSSTYSTTTSSFPTSSLSSHATTSTSSIFSTFSGVSVSVISAPSSCYQLPTPTASLTLVPYNGTINSELNSPLNMYLGPNGTSAGYVGVMINGSNYLYDFTDPNKTAITSEKGNSMVINQTGVYFFGANCGSAVAINIPDFADQIYLSNQSLGLSKRSMHELVERTTAAEVDFLVDLTLTNQCGQPYNGQSPTVQSGLTTCGNEGSNNGEYTFDCQYPGAMSDEATCETDVGGVLSTVVVAGLFATSPWWPGSIAKILPKNIIALVAEALGLELEIGALIAAVVVVTILQKLLLSLGVDAVTHKICLAIYGNQAMDLIMLLNGQQYPLGVITTATPTAQSLTVNDPSAPSCCLGGSCGTYTTCGLGGTCFCGSDVNGVSACVLDEYCDVATPCSANTDCSTGWICLAANCCGFSVCIDATSCVPGASQIQTIDASIYNTSAIEAPGRHMAAGYINGA